uniref:Uncharacterized protein n=1 Tax=Eutreptiella gymnastica TaxID=73025 RepID=A0A7S1I975_9EUGL|mmetsp:Transcript_140139/g.244056  ORF Transcript_140139/g.244056 Transcript_140139/m.244056 type:complete len:322 (+) Transcript_140139:192-1157(+)
MGRGWSRGRRRRGGRRIRILASPAGQPHPMGQIRGLLPTGRRSSSAWDEKQGWEVPRESHRLHWAAPCHPPKSPSGLSQGASTASTSAAEGRRPVQSLIGQLHHSVGPAVGLGEGEGGEFASAQAPPAGHLHVMDPQYRLPSAGPVRSSAASWAGRGCQHVPNVWPPPDSLPQYATRVPSAGLLLRLCAWKRRLACPPTFVPRAPTVRSTDSPILLPHSTQLGPLPSVSSTTPGVRPNANPQPRSHPKLTKAATLSGPSGASGVALDWHACTCWCPVCLPGSCYPQLQLLAAKRHTQQETIGGHTTLWTLEHLRTPVGPSG